jgi:hypothetical protein
MGRDTLLEALGPVLDVLAGVQPGDEGLEDRLNRDLPISGQACSALRAAAEQGVAEGWLCDREAGGIRFSRPVKPGPESHGYSVDAVVMDRCVGPKHTHTNGEIDLCYAQDGEPRFDGHPAGWVVFPPGSTHRPTVSDGRMLILYFLPGGAIEFHRE